MEGVLSSEMQELKEDRQNMMEAVAVGRFNCMSINRRTF